MRLLVEHVARGQACLNILRTTGPDPVGAAALLVPPAVIEAVRLRCAHLRSCASCSAVRITAGTEDGLSEAKIALLDRPEAARRARAHLLPVDGVIRVTWALIWINQLHRLGLVLHRGR